MGWEIERRYLVRVDPALWERLDGGRALRQGYLRIGSPSVRIRTGESRGAVLTCKSGSGIRREEIDTVVPPEMAGPLLAACEGRVLAKRRWVLGPWELDRFEGDLEGMTLLEIELDDEGDPVPQAPDGITIIREVTMDNTMTSSHLASLSSEAREALVRQIYRQIDREDRR